MAVADVQLCLSTLSNNKKSQQSRLSRRNVVTWSAAPLLVQTINLPDGSFFLSLSLMQISWLKQRHSLYNLPVCLCVCWKAHWSFSDLCCCNWYYDIWSTYKVGLHLSLCQTEWERDEKLNHYHHHQGLENSARSSSKTTVEEVRLQETANIVVLLAARTAAIHPLRSV